MPLRLYLARIYSVLVALDVIFLTLLLLQLLLLFSSLLSSWFWLLLFCCCHHCCYCCYCLHSLFSVVSMDVTPSIIVFSRQMIDWSGYSQRGFEIMIEIATSSSSCGASFRRRSWSHAGFGEVSRGGSELMMSASRRRQSQVLARSMSCTVDRICMSLTRSFHRNKSDRVQT